jgi:lipid-binding SYLF domain-containing protein
MKNTQDRNPGQNLFCRTQPFIATLLILSLILLAPSFIAAQDIKKIETLVVEAQKTFDNFMIDPDMGWFRDHIKDAKAILIIPSLLKGGFIVGGSGGSGALLTRNEQTGKLSYPAFYTLGAASIGLQAGAQKAQVILMVMTAKGKDSLMATSFKLGGDVSVAAGPVGAGKGAATADILTFTKAVGAFAGLSLDGSIIQPRDKWNSEYYGKEVRVIDIIERQQVENPQADNLRKSVDKAIPK